MKDTKDLIWHYIMFRLDEDPDYSRINFKFLYVHVFISDIVERVTNQQIKLCLEQNP